MHCQTIDIERFETFLEESEARRFYQQSAAAKRLDEMRDQKSELIGFFKGVELVAVARMLYYPAVKMFLNATLNFGPVGLKPTAQDYHLAATALIAYLKRKFRVISFRWAPLVVKTEYDDIEPKADTVAGGEIRRELTDLGFEPVTESFVDAANVQATYFYVKDIADMTFDEAMKSMDYNVRSEIRKAKKYGPELRWLAADEADVFNQMLKETYEAKGVPLHTAAWLTPEHFKAFGENLRVPLVFVNRDAALAHNAAEQADLEEQIRVLEERDTKRSRRQIPEVEGELNRSKKRREELEALFEGAGTDTVNLAAAMFYFAGDEVIYFQAAETDSGLNCAPAYLIHEAMFEEAIRLDIKRYNFFAVSGTDEDAHDYSVLQFKRKFQGDLEELIGTFDYAVFKLPYVIANRK